jgi:hypothetical protein
MPATPRLGYQASLRYAEIGGRWIITDLIVSMHDPGPTPSSTPPSLWNGFSYWPGVNDGGVTSSVVSELSWAELRDFAGLALEPTGSIRLDEALMRLPTSLPSRRPGRTSRQKAEIAAAYVEAVKGGVRAPNLVLAARLGLTESSARALIRNLRREGFLTSPGRGHGGGELTRLAQELLGGG